MNDGHLDCSRTHLKLYTWRERETQPMSSQDCLWKTSPSALETQPFRERNIAEEYINYVTVNAVPKVPTLKQIAYATETDPLLQHVQRCLGGSEWPDTPELNPLQARQG